jgi:hypothetical protein
MAVPPHSLLYSTNCYLKFRIARDYLGHHHVWCSTRFNSQTAGKYELGAHTPPSSNPFSIYRDLLQASSEGDEHSYKIEEQRTRLTALAVKLESSGILDSTTKEEIAEIVRLAPFTEFRPLLYIIPCGIHLEGRSSLVPRSERASAEPEFIVTKLAESEFQLMEFPYGS